VRLTFHRRVELESWAAEHALSAQIPPPDDWPSQWRVESHGVAPLWQGDYLPGLSATYAVVNGLRLVSAGHCRLTACDERALLAQAWRWRADREPITPERGLRQGEWLRMAEDLCHHFNRRHDQYVTVWQPWPRQRPTRTELFTGVERLIVGRQAVLTLFAGARYSIIRGFTAASWLLFDSGEHCWLKRGSVGLVGTAPILLHQIAASSLLVMRRGL
jgi:hypothetical protein